MIIVAVVVSCDLTPNKHLLREPQPQPFPCRCRVAANAATSTLMTSTLVRYTRSLALALQFTVRIGDTLGSADHTAVATKPFLGPINDTDHYSVQADKAKNISTGLTLSCARWSEERDPG